MTPPVDHLKAQDKIAWWVRTLVNIYAKLYSNHFGDFCRDHRRLIHALYHFRQNCAGRGWQIPEAQQERLLGKLVSRCQEALNKQAVDRTYIPGYFGKSLARFVGEVADEAQLRWKKNVDMKGLPPDMLKPIIEAAMARTIVQKVEAA